MNKAHQKKLLLSALVLGILISLNCGGKMQREEAFTELKDIEPINPFPLSGWKFHLDDVADGQRPELDDANWQTVDPNYTWSVNPVCWFRKEVVIPEEMAGKAILAFLVRSHLAKLGGEKMCEREYSYETSCT